MKVRVEGKKEALGLRFVSERAKGNKFERLLVLDFGYGAVLHRAVWIEEKSWPWSGGGRWL